MNILYNSGEWKSLLLPVRGFISALSFYLGIIMVIYSMNVEFIYNYVVYIK